MAPKEIEHRARVSSTPRDVDEATHEDEHGKFCHELATYLEKFKSVQKAAEKMHMHPSTVKARIREWGENDKNRFIELYGKGSTPETRMRAIQAGREKRSTSITGGDERPLYPSSPTVTLAPVTSMDPEADEKKTTHGMHDSPQKMELEIVYKQKDPIFIRAFVAQMIVHKKGVQEAVAWLRNEKIIGEDSDDILEELEKVEKKIGKAGISFVEWLREGLPRGDDTQQNAATEAARALDFHPRNRSPNHPPKKSGDESGDDIDNDF